MKNPKPASVDAFVKRFIAAPPQSATPQDRIRRWVDAANLPSATPSKRKQAIRNVRRLVERYPATAEQMLREAPVSEEAV